MRSDILLHKHCSLCPNMLVNRACKRSQAYCVESTYWHRLRPTARHRVSIPVIMNDDDAVLRDNLSGNQVLQLIAARFSTGLLTTIGVVLPQTSVMSYSCPIDIHQY